MALAIVSRNSPELQNQRQRDWLTTTGPGTRVRSCLPQSILLSAGHQMEQYLAAIFAKSAATVRFNDLVGVVVARRSAMGYHEPAYL